MTAINSNRAIRGPVTAVPVVAGKGVRLVADTENNRWVVEADETVLWEDQDGAILHNGITLSESRLNFEYIRLEVSCQIDLASPRTYIDIPMSGINAGSAFQFMLDAPFNNATTATNALNWKVLMSATDTTLQSTTALYWGKGDFDGTQAHAGTWIQGSNVNVPYIYKVVGCRRIASN